MIKEATGVELAYQQLRKEHSELQAKLKEVEEGSKMLEWMLSYMIDRTNRAMQSPDQEQGACPDEWRQWLEHEYKRTREETT